ncbi:xanthine dehydrogenase family protein molybdopterin-binding subunit [Deinococcus radiopugnans]|uniref:Carbon-monoxide dehydrogenase large subunit n=1 Tax=Deinococcus radiopugnans ATCC 19172 TaxID=585398 RepID=A0A5C4Y6K8_9DEIO|nr:molybdopterin cofactor-binding domain-containing protein [Deinococcus radiopugnans]MBB6016479.1 carbon-monoxide dehydrogenase large subunit [Deinococcus radiopugnans ATCC 19172]TNM71180.1 xanthine dehydrogenase family protein molybdopterin-binding subunit [Deinococcus radiopugnans ATCC 19172]
MTDNANESRTDKYVGQALKRKEDPRFITGAGNYTDDIVLPGMLHAAMVRSPYPHAKINGINKESVTEMPGVVAVLTGQDIVDAGIGSIPVGWLLPELKTPAHPAIALTEANHVGDIVAVVIAENRALAEDAASMLEVDYEPLPSVAFAGAAIAEGAPVVHDDVPGNVAFNWEIGDSVAVQEGFNRAHKTVKLKLTNQRLIPNAIEPRASLAQFTPASGEYLLYTTSQNPHIHRLILAAFVMNIPEHKLRVISPDVGGGFGSKIFQYQEEVIMLLAARLTGRPVKWTARRSEAFVSDMQGRDHETETEMAVDENGKMLAFRVNTLANLGAYQTLFAPAVPTYLYGTLCNGVYKLPAVHVKVQGVMTNTVPVDAYRGAGRPEATYAIERTVDAMAHAIGEDPAEFRRKNFIQPEDFPYQTPVALVYDSGNYEPALDMALNMMKYQELRAEQEKMKGSNKILGVSVISYVEACGLAPSALVGQLGAQAGQWESSLVRVYPTGKVELFTGSHSHGQGHETAFPQIAADELQIPIEDIDLVHGDTGRMPYGWGTYGSRSAAVGGSALKVALQKITAKAKKIAAHLLEASEEDVEHENGVFRIKGAPDQSKTFFDVALMAHLAHSLPDGMEPGLEATAFYDPKNFVYPFGTHMAVVEIDTDTGKVDLRNYGCVDDCGPLINPLIVEGQVHGGIAQGAGQALWEEGAYDEEGNLLAASYMEYTMPRADDLPMYQIDHTVTPSPHNPLGVKGIGESGTIASSSAVANAVLDALWHECGIEHMDMPYTAEKVWKAIRDSRAGMGQAADD